MKNYLSVALIIFCSLSFNECSSPTQATYNDNSNTLSQGLVAYYPFNGNANDSSGNDYNIVNHGAAYGPDRFNNPNSALSFNGSAYIDLGNILNNVFSTPVAKFSIAGWAMSLQYGGDGFLIGKNGGGTKGPYQWSISHINGIINAQVFFDTLAHNYMTLTTSVSTNRWFHFVLVFDGSLPIPERLKFYIDGQMFSVDSSSVGIAGTTTVSSEEHLSMGASIGVGQIPSDFYNGELDDIRIYNRPLSVAEIQALYLKSN